MENAVQLIIVVIYFLAAANLILFPYYDNTLMDFNLDFNGLMDTC